MSQEMDLVEFGLGTVEGRRRRDRLRLAFAAFTVVAVGAVLLVWQVVSFSDARMIGTSVFVYSSGIGLFWFMRRSDVATAVELQDLMGSDVWDDSEPEDQPEPVQGLSVVALVAAAFLASALFAGLGFVALKLVPTWIASGGGHPPADTAQSLALERSNLRTAALGVVAAFGAGLGLLMTFHGHRHQAQEAARVERDRARGRRNARLSLAFERFNDAIKQLAEPDLQQEDPTRNQALEPVSRVGVRLAGVYSLGSVALESRQQRPAVRDVLTAFVADHQERHRLLDDQEDHVDDYESAEDLRDARRAVSAPADVAAALVVLSRIYGQDLQVGAPKLALAYADLAGADLRDADLRGADLEGANLTGANLRRAQLDGAQLTDALLVRADVRGAHMPGTHGVDTAVLTGARFEGAVMDAALDEALRARAAAPPLTDGDRRQSA